MSKKNNNNTPKQAPLEAEILETDTATSQEAPPGEDISPETLLTQQLDALTDTHKRTLAEYDNFRKRSARERETLYPEAENGVLTKLLPMLDNFGRALEAPCTDAEYKKGMEMIYTTFWEALTALGIEEINPEGEPFDPNLHYAVMHTEDSTLGENLITTVLQKGYKRGERILRFAMVQTVN